MYVQAIGTSSTTLSALSEEPGFRGFDRSASGTARVLWESESTAHRPRPDFTGRLLNVYRASGRPA
jgi:hypothetical protein